MRNNRDKRSNTKTRSVATLRVVGIMMVFTVLFAGIWILSRSERVTAGLPDQISTSEAFSKREAGAFILDVREPEEWQEFHVPGSTLIPLGELENRVDELSGDQEIVVVCRSGNRSQAGRDILLQAGFTQVTSMTGGLKEWRSSGYPTVTGP